MGAGASTNSGVTDKPISRETVNYLQTQCLAPEDASDVTDLETARKEIAHLRALAKEHLQGGLAEKALGGGNPKNKQGRGNNRAAVRGERVPEVDLANYQKKVVEKDDAKKELIRKAIANNILFRGSTAEDLGDIILAFEEVTAAAGEEIILQGDKGDHFFVVDAGDLDIFVAQGDSPAVQVGSIGPGTSFGELALMYNQPRAATIKAQGAVTLWSLSRTDFRGITTYQKMQRMNDYMDFLRGVEIMGSKLSEKLNDAQLSKMALALEIDQFEDGDKIFRQGETGEYFYIIESGKVKVLVDDDEKVQLERGQYFGERALLSDDVRAATCEASGKVKCLVLHGSDFAGMFGDWGGMGASSAAPESTALGGGAGGNASQYADMKFEDLEIGRTLGCGAFGRVKIVKNKGDGTAFALKCQSKAAIVENNLQEHVLNERGRG